MHMKSWKLVRLHFYFFSFRVSPLAYSTLPSNWRIGSSRCHPAITSLHRRTWMYLINTPNRKSTLLDTLPLFPLRIQNMLLVPKPCLGRLLPTSHQLVNFGLSPILLSTLPLLFLPQLRKQDAQTQAELTRSNRTLKKVLNNWIPFGIQNHANVTWCVERRHLSNGKRWRSSTMWPCEMKPLLWLWMDWQWSQSYSTHGST